MKFFTTLTLAASASAASLAKKQAQELNIAEFAADCIPHSASCSYSFTVPSPLSHCQAFITAAGSSLPDIAEGKCEDNVAYTWSSQRTDAGDFKFAIWYAFNSRSNITYCHTAAAADFEMGQNGAAFSEHYRGSKEFVATVGECFA